jgi:hypothetical protein
MEILVTLGIVVGIVIVVEFFHIGYLVNELRRNVRVISGQLDQLLVASGVPDPRADRLKLIEDGKANW